MADIICRWRNSSVKQALEFSSLLLCNDMTKNDARKIIEKRWNIVGGKDFFTTPYQLAAQMGMYYEDDAALYSRFSSPITVEDASDYLSNWGKHYYAPNPYTKSMDYTTKPVVINRLLVNWVLEHDTPKLSEALSSAFPDTLGNLDILTNMINSFMDVNVEDDIMSLKDGLQIGKFNEVSLDFDAKDKKLFFDYVGGEMSKGQVPALEENKLSPFIFKVIETCYEYDSLKALMDITERGSQTLEATTYVCLNTPTFNISRLFTVSDIESVNAMSSTPRRLFTNPFVVNGESFFLTTQWADAESDTTNATFDKFERMINTVYSGVFKVSKTTSGTDRRYQLFDLRKTNAMQPLETGINRIYFGTPGSGKSHKVNEIVHGCENFTFRTTFHPDSDYASFVGSYKPVTDGNSISYKFVPQAFANAYVAAWKNPGQQVYLVIEEINRGNCAQIFGDLFQLLDRDTKHKSEYSIKADTDLKHYLEGEDVLGHDHAGIKNGEILIPGNLTILATMNTSDQSLFPMDSAFKRRWDWEFVPSDPGCEDSNFTITIGDKKYSWPDFMVQANKRILKLSESEDKQMGNFFIKNDLNEDEFKSKVMFYLWSEVCKDYYKSGSFFKNANKGDEEFTFNELYPQSEETTDMLQGFMAHLDVEAK